MIVIGLISGTSFDAIEVAAGDFAQKDDVLRMRPLGAISVAYDLALRDKIARSLPPADITAGDACELDTHIGKAFAGAARAANDRLCDGRAELIVSHGQTLFHWVTDGRARGTLQLGQPAWIAQATGLPVVHDLRARDIAAGGQGAPLVSMLDLLVLPPDASRAALNLGGISNITVTAPDADPVAYDIGPANALLDAAVTHSTGGRVGFDHGGERAARGRVDRALLDRMLEEPYYDRAPPKSTGKELFNIAYLRDVLGHLDIDDDVLATLTALTAVTVGRELRRRDVVEVFVSGGGTRNQTMMKMLAEQAGDTTISPIEALGLPATAKEAYAFALMGWLTAHHLPGAVHACTGAVEATVLGSIVPGSKPLKTKPATAPPRRLVVEA